MNRKINIAVIGSGGREHAICYAINKSKHLNKLFAIPGNAGISRIAECADINVMEFDKIVEFCKSNCIYLVFVAPDDPLAGGLVDILNENGIVAFGPQKKAAIIEYSKAYAKDFMRKYNIPTAKYEIFDDYNQAIEFIKTTKFPIVIKADGLALGKGVIICHSYDEACDALMAIMVDKKFNNAGNTIIIEEFLTGKEMSVFIFTDGKNYSIMPTAQDYKKAYDNDEGLNTGGMGAISPAEAYNEKLLNKIAQSIIEPTLTGLQKEDRVFKGILYIGLIIDENSINVLEYNARFGDPETQAILPLLETDIVEIMYACIENRLNGIDIHWNNSASVCVVAVNGDYPLSVEKGALIDIENTNNVLLFHSGTKIIDNKLCVNGGRVISVCAVSDNVSNAREIVYTQIRNIHFDKMRYRMDIGRKK